MMLPQGFYVVLGCAVILGVLSTWATRELAVRYGIVNHPNPIVPQHRKPVAYLGGAAVFVATLVTVALARLLGPHALRLTTGGWPALNIALPATLYLCFGIVDDMQVLSPGKKFIGQAAIAASAVLSGLAHPFLGQPVVDGFVSAFWILCLVNAFNLTDVCDGLVSGLATILFLFVCHFRQDQALLAIVVAGTLLGFLFFNSPPASIFLGDGGSHLLGFLAAALTLLTSPERSTWPYVPQAVLLAGVPLFELVFLILIRIRKRLPFWKGSPDHFSLRLQAAGLSQTQTDLIAWGMASALCGAALTMEFAPLRWQVLIVAAALAALIASGFLLLRCEVQPQGPARTGFARTPTPVERHDFEDRL